MIWLDSLRPDAMPIHLEYMLFLLIDGEVVFAPEGGNSGNDQERFPPVHLVPERGNADDEQILFAPKGGKPVECFGELDLALVQSLQDPTGLGRWEVVTDQLA